MSEGKNIEMGGLKLYHQGFQGHQLERSLECTYYFL